MGWVQLVEDEARLRGYSDRTITNYKYFIGNFLKSKKQPKLFLLDLINRGKSTETVRQACFAIKFYLKIINKEDANLQEVLNDIPIAKREKRLPVILSKNEVEKMIMATKNLNHRLMLQIGFSSGLRASEIINLRWEDIDFDRNIIHIKRGKGKKDRIVMLSEKVKQGLQDLSMEKAGLIFMTQRDTKYTLRTIQKIVENSAKKVEIKKKVTPHTLRHSFATHLLEQGIALRHIKELLGHANISTTQIYTKVSRKNLMNIKSPLDD